MVGTNYNLDNWDIIPQNIQIIGKDSGWFDNKLVRFYRLANMCLFYVLFHAIYTKIVVIHNRVMNLAYCY